MILLYRWFLHLYQQPNHSLKLTALSRGLHLGGWEETVVG
jgi:hypothetical protein